MKIVGSLETVQVIIRQWQQLGLERVSEVASQEDADGAEAPAKGLIDPRRINQFIDPTIKEEPSDG